MAVSRTLPESLLARFKWQVDLVGAKNGVNMTYTAPENFLEETIRVYLNGVRQRRGVGCDFIVSESGGVGTGFDTVEFQFVSPVAGDNLFADYTTES